MIVGGRSKNSWSVFLHSSLIVTPIWGDYPNWLIFCKWVEITKIHENKKNRAKRPTNKRPTNKRPTNNQHILQPTKNHPNEELPFFCFKSGGSEVWCLGRWDGTLRMVLHGHLWWWGHPVSGGVGGGWMLDRCRNPRFCPISLVLS